MGVSADAGASGDPSPTVLRGAESGGGTNARHQRTQRADRDVSSEGADHSFVVLVVREAVLR